MLNLREQKMGRFSVEFDVANYSDVVASRMGALAAEKVRRARIKGLVDTGATQLVLPAKVAKQLGLRETDRIKVRYADGRKATRNFVDDAYLEMLGRHGTFQAIVEPNARRHSSVRSCWKPLISFPIATTSGSFRAIRTSYSAKSSE